MAEINSVHEAPVHVASVGHMKVALTGAHTSPKPLVEPGAGETPKVRRQRAKAAVKARQQEIRRGAGFLEKLTITRQKD